MVKEYKARLNEVSKLQQFVNKCLVHDKLEIIGKHGKFIVDAKSIMGLLSLDLSEPVILEVSADGEKAVELIHNFENDIEGYLLY